ncbi:hypothetical protein AVEN_61607-1, partial [Araneus ventricosus]
DFSIETESFCLSVHLLNTARASLVVDLSFAPVRSLITKTKSHLLMSEGRLLAASFRKDLISDQVTEKDPCAEACCCCQKTGHWEVCVATFLL